MRPFIIFIAKCFWKFFKFLPTRYANWFFKAKKQQQLCNTELKTDLSKMWVFLVVRPVQKSNNLKKKKQNKKMFTHQKEKKNYSSSSHNIFCVMPGSQQNFFSAPIQSLLNSDSNPQLFGQFVILCVNSLLQPCTYIIVYLMKKWKKK